MSLWFESHGDFFGTKKLSSNGKQSDVGAAAACTITTRTEPFSWSYIFFLKRPIKQNFNQPLEFVSRSLFRNCRSDKYAAVLTLPQCRVLSKFSQVNHNVDQNRYWHLLAFRTSGGCDCVVLLVGYFSGTKWNISQHNPNNGHGSPCSQKWTVNTWEWMYLCCLAFVASSLKLNAIICGDEKCQSWDLSYESVLQLRFSSSGSKTSLKGKKWTFIIKVSANCSDTSCGMWFYAENNSLISLFHQDSSWALVQPVRFCAGLVFSPK